MAMPGGPAGLQAKAVRGTYDPPEPAALPEVTSGGSLSGTGAYLAWNDALAARFFRPEAAGERVYLFVTEEVIAELGQSLGGGLPGFIAAIHKGPPGVTRSGHCQRALQVAQDWRHRGYEYPPYIAYLALFVLAGGHKGDFDPRSYYPRLWDLLGEDDEQGTPPSFHRMLELWDDLERWSLRDRNGDVGILDLRIVGQKIHIGLPLAQTLLTEDERHSLPGIFADARLEPGTSPSDHEFLRALRVHGSGSLTARTSRALASSSKELVDALLDVVAAEFLNWNGEVAANGQSGGVVQRVAASLRLCLLLDVVGGRAAVNVRCRSSRELPELGLRLTGAPGGLVLSCSPFLPSWSNPLQLQTDGSAFVPGPSLWREGLTLTDSSSKWSAQLRPARIRAFVEGRGEQLPGQVEVSELPPRTPVHLAFHSDDLPRLQSWLERDAPGWDALAISAGLPPGWLLIRVPEARTDTGPKALDDRVRFRERRTVRLVGGIKTARGNTFFAFAPPQVAIDGGVPGDAVLCNDRELHEVPGHAGTYNLPPDAPVDQASTIELRHGDDAIRRTSFFLVSGVGWALDHALATFDGYGRPLGEGGGGVAGASVPDIGYEPPPMDLFRTSGLRLSAPRTYFLGRAPGQIVTWPIEQLPTWKPVWAIPFGRHGQALYCGDSVPDDMPTSTPVGDASRVAQWRDVLWWRRKRIREPSERGLKSLWRRYQEAARSA